MVSTGILVCTGRPHQNRAFPLVLQATNYIRTLELVENQCKFELKNLMMCAEWKKLLKKRENCILNKMEVDTIIPKPSRNSSRIKQSGNKGER